MMWQISLGAARQFSPNNTGVPESSIMFAGYRMSTFCLPACAPGEDIVGQQLKLRFYCCSSCGNSDRDPGDHLALPPHGTATGTERQLKQYGLMTGFQEECHIKFSDWNLYCWMSSEWLLKNAQVPLLHIKSGQYQKNAANIRKVSTWHVHTCGKHFLTFYIAKIIIYMPENSAQQSLPNARDSAIYI